MSVNVEDDQRIGIVGRFRGKSDVIRHSRAKNPPPTAPSSLGAPLTTFIEAPAREFKQSTCTRNADAVSRRRKAAAAQRHYKTTRYIPEPVSPAKDAEDLEPFMVQVDSARNDHDVAVAQLEQSVRSRLQPDEHADGEGIEALFSSTLQLHTIGRSSSSAMYARKPKSSSHSQSPGRAIRFTDL